MVEEHEDQVRECMACNIVETLSVLIANLSRDLLVITTRIIYSSLLHCVVINFIEVV